MSYTHQVLAVLARERRDTVARDAAAARRFGLRRGIVTLIYGLAFAFVELGAALDEEPVPGTLHA